MATGKLNPPAPREEAPKKEQPPTGSDSERWDLSSFRLEQCVLEIRYPLALSLWDSSGAMWRSILEKWPDLKPVTADPMKTNFQRGKTGFIVEARAARVNSIEPEDSVETLSKTAKEFFGLATQYLQISLFERLGLRLIYFKEFKDRRQAASAFHSWGLVRVPDARKFEIEGQPVNPQCSLRWESEKKGVWVQCRAETRKVDYDPPVEAAQTFKPIHTERNGIVLDIDYYTVAPVEVGQVDMAEWAKHAMHVIVRDSGYLFEGQI